jgi:hypothetical protein
MAHMQLEVEKQKKKKSPVADIVSMKYWWGKKKQKKLACKKVSLRIAMILFSMYCISIYNL